MFSSLIFRLLKGGLLTMPCTRRCCLPVLLLISLCVFNPAWAIPQSRSLLAGEGPWVVRVYQVTPADVGRLQQHFDVWAADSDDRYAVVGLPGRAQLEALLGLGYEVVVDPAATERYRTPLTTGFGSGTIPSFPCYRTVEQTLITAQDLVTAHPDLASLTDVGDSWEKTQNNTDGYDLWVLRLTNQKITGDKPKLFVMSAIHARELTTAEVLTRFAERLVQSYGNNADSTWLLDHHEVHLLLQSNPDGRKQAEVGQLWRKNTNQAYCGATSTSRGADLNRNFPWEWGGAASTNPCSSTYQGPSPGSEPEVVAVVDYVRALFPDQRGDGLNDPAPLDSTGVFIDIHSFSQLVLWPYGFSNTAGQAPNQPQLSALGRRLAFFNGYRPQQILGLTAASGSTADFAYGELGVAAFAFELGTDFFQQCDFFENAILEQNIASLMYAAKVARTPYRTPDGPDITRLQLHPNVVLSGDTAGLEVTADGTRFSTVTDATSPLEPPRQVAGVNVYVNTLPWAGSATTTANADDGGFDSTVETASATLDTNGLSPGRYTVFSEAVGTSAQAGALSAAFLHVLDGATAGRLFGDVVINGTQIPLPGALIQVGAFQTLSDAQGAYSLPLPAGTYPVTVSGDGVMADAGTVTLAAGEVMELNLSLPSRCDLFADDVEEGTNGWTTTGNWAITSEQANSPVQSWHDSPGGDYNNNQNVILTSPVLDLSTAGQTVLDFHHSCDTEAGFDFGIVEISSDGSNWQEVYRCDNQIAWQQQSIAVAALDGAATAQVRFRLNTDVGVTDNGWYVDDIRVSAVSSQCLPETSELLFTDGFEQ